MDEVNEQTTGASISSGYEKRSGFAVASLVLGILSLFLMWFYYIGFGTSIISIILGILALKDIKSNFKKGRGMAIAGVILSVLALVVYLIGLLIFNFVVKEQLDVDINKTKEGIANNASLCSQNVIEPLSCVSNSGLMNITLRKTKSNTLSSAVRLAFVNTNGTEQFGPSIETPMAVGQLYSNLYSVSGLKEVYVTYSVESGLNEKSECVSKRVSCS